MKRLFTLFALALSLVMAGSLKNSAAAQANTGVNITYQDFYDELSPYGEWMDYPEYGYVWVPRMEQDFQPYRSNGHWVWSDDYEWIWVSDYSWGWAPFHYGRWFQDARYGWMWMPGYEWSPAWVAWRDGGDYYGWAPLRPGISINIGFGSYNPPVDYWCFAPRRYISSPRIYNYCAPRSQNITIINHTTIINNYNSRRTNNIFVSNGPRRGDAERYSGRINPIRVRDINSPGRTRFRGNELSVYRPGIQRDNNRTFAPRSFERYDRNQGGNGNSTVRRNDNNLPQRGNDARINGRDNDNGTINNTPRQRGNTDNNTGFGDRRVRERGNNNVSQAPPADRSTPNNGNDNRVRDRQNRETRPIERTNPVDRSSGSNAPIDQPGRRSGTRPGGFERPSTDRQRPVENNSNNNRFERRSTNMPAQENRRMEQPQQRNVERQSRQPQANREQSRPSENRSQGQGRSGERGGRRF